MKALFTITLFSLFLFSCSLVKNPQSSNFHRVKHHAHLKKNKKVFVSTVESFENKEKDIDSQTATEPIKKKELLVANNILADTALGLETRVKRPILSQQLNTILKDATQLKVKNKKKIALVHDWWEDDPEDWPWGEIVLAVIAILVIAILIVILIDLIGAIVGSLLGLIFLLALAYFLYQYWV